MIYTSCSWATFSWSFIGLTNIRAILVGLVLPNIIWATYGLISNHQIFTLLLSSSIVCKTLRLSVSCYCFFVLFVLFCFWLVDSCCVIGYVHVDANCKMPWMLRFGISNCVILFKMIFIFLLLCLGHPQTCVYPDVCLGIAHVSGKGPLSGQGKRADTQCICTFPLSRERAFTRYMGNP